MIYLLWLINSSSLVPVTLIKEVGPAVFKQDCDKTFTGIQLKLGFSIWCKTLSEKIRRKKSFQTSNFQILMSASTLKSTGHVIIWRRQPDWDLDLTEGILYWMDVTDPHRWRWTILLYLGVSVFTKITSYGSSNVKLVIKIFLNSGCDTKCMCCSPINISATGHIEESATN